MCFRYQIEIIKLDRFQIDFRQALIVLDIFQTELLFLDRFQIFLDIFRQRTRIFPDLDRLQIDFKQKSSFCQIELFNIFKYIFRCNSKYEYINFRQVFRQILDRLQIDFRYDILDVTFDIQPKMPSTTFGLVKGIQGDCWTTLEIIQASVGGWVGACLCKLCIAPLVTPLLYPSTATFYPFCIGSGLLPLMAPYFSPLYSHLYLRSHVLSRGYSSGGPLLVSTSMAAYLRPPALSWAAAPFDGRSRGGEQRRRRVRNRQIKLLSRCSEQ